MINNIKLYAKIRIYDLLKFDVEIFPEYSKFNIKFAEIIFIKFLIKFIRFNNTIIKNKWAIMRFD